MQPLDIQTRVTSEATRAAETSHRPEAVSVLVDLSPVGGVGGESVVRMVAPMVAKAEYPARAFGDVLAVERISDVQWIVAVAVVERGFDPYNVASHQNGR